MTLRPFFGPLPKSVALMCGGAALLLGSAMASAPATAPSAARLPANPSPLQVVSLRSTLVLLSALLVPSTESEEALEAMAGFVTLFAGPLQTVEPLPGAAANPIE